MRVLIQLRHTPQLHATATGSAAFAAMAPAVERILPGFALVLSRPNSKAPRAASRRQPVYAGSASFILC